MVKKSTSMGQVARLNVVTGFVRELKIFPTLRWIETYVREEPPVV